MKIELELKGSVTLGPEEIKVLHRLLKRECEGADTCDNITFEMWHKLNGFFKEVEEHDKHYNTGRWNNNDRPFELR